MEIHRIFPKTGNNYAYIESTGLKRNTRSKLSKGESIKSEMIFNFIVKRKSKPFPDFLGVGTSEFFINEKLRNIFQEFVEPTKLLLPEVEILGKPYFLLNTLGGRTAIDRTRSKFSEFKSGKVEEFEELYFENEDISEYDIFRLKHYRIPIFITEKLKFELEKVDCTGIFFSNPSDVLSLNF